MRAYPGSGGEEGERERERKGEKEKERKEKRKEKKEKILSRFYVQHKPIAALDPTTRGS